MPIGGAVADLRAKIIEQIDAAKYSIDVVVYDIRSSEIGDALVRASRRGVRVRVVVDDVRSASPTTQEKLLDEERIAIRRLSGKTENLLHDKFILFDSSLVATPSYNRSARAVRNTGDEESFTREKEVIQDSKRKFEGLWGAASRPTEQDPL